MGAEIFLAEKGSQCPGNNDLGFHGGLGIIIKARIWFLQSHTAVFKNNPYLNGGRDRGKTAFDLLK